MSSSSPAEEEYGLVIGRFIPPHAGHQHLISQAYERSNKRLIVMIMARADEKIPGYLRQQWLAAQNQKPDLHICLVNQNLPEDYDDPKVWQMWIELIRDNLAGRMVSRVCSSETYGQKLADLLGVRHELVDLAREAHNISGTKVRQNFEENWHYLHPDVYAWMKAHSQLFSGSSSARFETPPQP